MECIVDLRPAATRSLGATLSQWKEQSLLSKMFGVCYALCSFKHVAKCADLCKYTVSPGHRGFSPGALSNVFFMPLSLLDLDTVEVVQGPMHCQEPRTFSGTRWVQMVNLQEPVKCTTSTPWWAIENQNIPCRYSSVPPYSPYSNL